MIAHVLDTSAILAHYLRESGAEGVNAILSKGPEASGISLVTLVELRGRLTELESDSIEAERIFKLYTETLTTILPFSRETADAATELRSATRPRLPLVDALIAASAKQMAQPSSIATHTWQQYNRHWSNSRFYRQRNKSSALRRKCPVLRTEMKHPSYPCGYAIEKVGPQNKFLLTA